MTILVAYAPDPSGEAALTAGIDAARGEVVVLMDSDGQHPVSLVADMVQRWREGSDVVYAIRRTNSGYSTVFTKGQLQMESF